jgi:putative DNA primase/helicase
MNFPDETDNNLLGQRKGEYRPNLQSAALGYARRGWHVHPCRPAAETFIDHAGKTVTLAVKTPYLPKDRDSDGVPIDGTGGLMKATRDLDLIRYWWSERYRGALIGVRMGEISGVWALDPDAPKKEGAPDGRANWESLCRGAGYKPFTHTHLTPNGGKHLLFRWNEAYSFKTTEGKFRELGINVRGNNSYIIAPPSRLADGRAYEIDEALDFFSFTEAPDWVYAMVLPPQKQRVLSPPTRREGGAVAARINGLLGVIANAAYGEKQSLTHWAARRFEEMVREGLITADRARELLVEEAVRSDLEYSRADEVGKRIVK